MNIQGGNTLSFIQAINDCSGAVAIYPYAAYAGGERLGARSDQFLRPSYSSIEPFLKTKSAEPEKEWTQTPEDRAKLDGLYECILFSPAARPHARSRWWNSKRYLGPAALLQSYRWLVDSRDEDTGARLDNLEDPFRLYRCHTIMNCALQVCPAVPQPGRTPLPRSSR